MWLLLVMLAAFIYPPSPKWLHAAYVALVFGDAVVQFFYISATEAYVGIDTAGNADPDDNADPASKSFPPRLTGFLDRILFFALAWLLLSPASRETSGPGSLFTAAAAWIALRFALDWQRRNPENKEEMGVVVLRTYISFFSQVLSVAIAAVGGTFAAGRIVW